MPEILAVAVDESHKRSGILPLLLNPRLKREMLLCLKNILKLAYTMIGHLAVRQTAHRKEEIISIVHTRYLAQAVEII